ncbi:DnaA regulatory inactivator Hda [Idiomarina tyrosinivorans]|uniref:DnaA regulatory inactivator Hda n=1 Tax=Idiomarina tyrosinivorans TaxID=1445662 RepID=A0A432ZUE9_9GAMM|nr:DnaA regulatory inactivator Hda [Idiomarina tyrosinivorans]RUO81471.1 DnaA regulatory inactivator Hda [Idiomarina tyrosinivorans]
MAETRSAGPQQLALAVQLPDDETFVTFIEGANGQTLSMLKNWLHQPPQDSISARMSLVWGAQAAGKSHLLHALCAAAAERLTVMYMPLRELAGQASPAMFEGLEHYDLICLDDIDEVLQQQQWAEALFALINRLTDHSRSLLLITASQSSQHLQAALNDLLSRLQWAATYHLEPLTDEQKREALIVRAEQRGLELGDEVARFMLLRLGRDMRDLMQCLERLDRASMAQKRRLTIPFIKQVLAI